MTTADEYVAMIANARYEPLQGLPGPAESATTMFGVQGSDIIKDNIGIETLATAFEAFDGIKSDPDVPGLG